MWYGTWECDSPRISIDGIDDRQFIGSLDQFQRDRLQLIGAETVQLSKSTPQNTAWLKRKKFKARSSYTTETLLSVEGFCSV